MPNRADSARSSDDRLQELAAILAKGILRLRQRTAVTPENPTEFSAPGLEVSGETVLSVQTG
jgi:hypothetical protein